MNCREYEADIVDLARGAGVSVEAESRLRGHLAACAGCAARLAREQRLTAVIREVADAAPQPSRADAIEAQLLRAFAERHGAGSRRASSSRPPAAAWPAWGWLATAAALVVAAVLWRGTVSWRWPDAAGPAPAAVATEPVEALAAAPAAAAPAPQPDDETVPAPRRDVSQRPAPVRAPAARSLVQPGDPADDDGVLRFVSLPTAVGLPELESGRIVRVELATAMLPAYGFDVVPGSDSGVVEADVLVGQDDQPRAIRFVNLRMDSRRRQ
ncbi:MAG: hypothetical protein R6V57_03655 [Vicinamibacterales bacterium]